MGDKTVIPLSPSFRRKPEPSVEESNLAPDRLFDLQSRTFATDIARGAGDMTITNLCLRLAEGDEGKAAAIKMRARELVAEEG